MPIALSDELRLKLDSLESLQAQAAAEGRACLVGGLVINPAGRIFVQKRSLERRLYPGTWDIIGGHVEAGESLFQALAREVVEETGWRLVQVVSLIEVFDWETKPAHRVEQKREFDFIIRVDGDLTRPVLEQGKVSEFRWVGEDDLDILNENRASGDDAIYRVVNQALQLGKGKR